MSAPEQIMDCPSVDAEESSIAPTADSVGCESHRSISLLAEDAFERGMGAWGAARYRQGAGIALYDRMLIEDDGPGIGSDAPWQRGDTSAGARVEGAVQIKKILHVSKPVASVAWLYVRPGARVEFNGHTLEGNNGAYFPVPPQWVRAGDNEIVLKSTGEIGPWIKFSPRDAILRNDPRRDDRPARSFVSHDGGQSWSPIDGEWMIRLHLVQYTAQGVFVSPALDLANNDPEGFCIASPMTIRSLSIDLEAEIPAETAIEVHVRTGTTPLYEPHSWTDWRDVRSPAPAGHRYGQWQATLKSANPLVTPVLHHVTVRATIWAEPNPRWARALASGEIHNPQIRYTSIPFAFEDPQHAKLRALREKYRLDDVVAGSRSELEQFVRLRDWVSKQWQKQVPEDRYPAWDADEILTEKYGFCVQFAIVYMQCAISLGYQTRFLFSNHPGARDIGHEICEVWSNEYQKWIYMDPADNFHYVDRKTNVPLSMLEAHDLMLKTYYGDEPATPQRAPKEDKTTPALGICYGLELEPTGSSPDWTKEIAVDGQYPISRMWMLLRYMPRNNFYGQTYPLPIRQGCHWDWTGYWAWEGAQMPLGQWLYGTFTGRRSDLEWTINQVRFDATAGDEPRVIKIQMCTVTPGFADYQISVDDGVWASSDAAFSWRLHPGLNRLQMRVTTTSGVEGPISTVEFNLDKASII